MRKLIGALLAAAAAGAVFYYGVMCSAHAGPSMPQFVQDKMESITIGVISQLKFAGCLNADDATQVGKLHIEAGYPIAVQQFGRLMEEEHCAVLDGRWFPHRVVWHGDLKQSTLKVVEMSPVGADDKPDFTVKFYILTERPVVGSGIKDRVAGIES